MNAMFPPMAEVIYREYFSENEYRQKMRQLAGFDDAGSISAGNQSRGIVNLIRSRFGVSGGDAPVVAPCA
jgi:hypothetical protein